MDLQSLGHAAGTYQQNPRIIEVGLRAVKAKAEFSLNGVKYFRSDDVIEAIAFLAKIEAEKAAAKASEAANAE